MQCREREKQNRELEVFQAFLKAVGWPNNDSIVNRAPPEPDILYEHPTLGLIAFELAENCSPDIAAAITGQLRDGEQYYTRTRDYFLDVLRNKQKKEYETPHPVDLIIYTDGRCATPDDYIIALSQQQDDTGRFRKIWYFGRQGVYDISSLMLHSVF
jgi:hypothetical protein